MAWIDIDEGTKGLIVYRSPFVPLAEFYYWAVSTSAFRIYFHKLR